MSALLLLGAGGHAKVVAETAIASGQFSQIGYLDDRFTGPGQQRPILGWPLLGTFAQAMEPELTQQWRAAFVAIGNSRLRLQFLQRLSDAGYQLPVLIHPTAWVSPSAQIGHGSAVFARATVQAQAQIGRGAILNTSCSVDHDAQLADGVHICPGAHLAGEVEVGARSWIGIGSSVIQQVCIGSDVNVGAGAAVVSDLPDMVTAVGVPAMVLDKP